MPLTLVSVAALDTKKVVAEVIRDDFGVVFRRAYSAAMPAPIWQLTPVPPSPQ